MKSLLPTVRLQSVRSIVIGGVIFLGYIQPAVAQTISASSIPTTIGQGSLAQLAADLAYPNSSQRFFEAGRQQFEAEIQHLVQENDQSEPLLTVKPEVLEQFED
ncbi:MAG: hypothetical protein AAF579_02550 [Cyanobacteria bacterium P01_C01_bin.118]